MQSWPLRKESIFSVKQPTNQPKRISKGPAYIPIKVCSKQKKNGEKGGGKFLQNHTTNKLKCAYEYGNLVCVCACFQLTGDSHAPSGPNTAWARTLASHLCPCAICMHASPSPLDSGPWHLTSFAYECVWPRSVSNQLVPCRQHTTRLTTTTMLVQSNSN